MSKAISFHRLNQFDGLADEPGADMLLFQYGVFDWGTGENFEVDLTRQFISAGVNPENADDAISQLHLIIYFAPTADLRGLGSYQRWLSDLDELYEFERNMEASPLFAALAAEMPSHAVVEWGLV